MPFAPFVASPRPLGTDIRHGTLSLGHPGVIVPEVHVGLLPDLRAEEGSSRHALWLGRAGVTKYRLYIIYSFV